MHSVHRGLDERSGRIAMPIERPTLNTSDCKQRDYKDIFDVIIAG